MTPSTTAYIQQIQQRYPALAVETVAFNQEGQYNDVLIVNQDLIFRFAKVPPAVATLRQEIAILHSLQPHISLAIPNPIYHHLETERIGEAFVGYRRIPGQMLWRDDLVALAEEGAATRMARQLAGFLHELHQVRVAEALPLALPLADGRADYVTMYARIRAELFPHMRAQARRQVANHFDAYLDNPPTYGFTPTLRHGDFGPGNILYDPTNGSLTGIIDFGGCGLGDPAVDFAGLYVSYGAAFYDQCSAAYPAMQAALPRVHFYAGAFALEEALFGLDHGDRQAFQNGLSAYIEK